MAKEPFEKHSSNRDTRSDWHEYSGRLALRSSNKTVNRLKLDATKAAEFLIGTVLKLSASSIDLARSQGLIRDFDFLAILVFFIDLC